MFVFIYFYFHMPSSIRILRNHKQDCDHISTNLCLELQIPKGYIYKTQWLT